MNRSKRHKSDLNCIQKPTIEDTITLAKSFACNLRICHNLIEKGVETKAVLGFKDFLTKVFLKDEYEENVNALFSQTWEIMYTQENNGQALSLPQVNSLVELLLYLGIVSIKRTTDIEVIEDELVLLDKLISRIRSRVVRDQNTKDLTIGLIKIDKNILNEIVRIQVDENSQLSFEKNSHIMKG